MSELESKASFFRQSGWMVIATFVGGALMFGVQLVASRLLLETESEFSDLYALLKIVTFLSIPAGGLTLVFAHQTAGAVTDESRRHVAACARGIGFGLFALWLGMILVVAAGQDRIMEVLHLKSSLALWMTMAVALTTLWTPVVRGLLQGAQRFGPFGWTALSDGLIRFGGVLVILLFVSRTAAGVMGAALLGQCVALYIGARGAREFLRRAESKVQWGEWIRGAVPLVLGSGVIVFFMTADAILAKSLYDRETYNYYIPGNMVGFAMALFVGPIAAVMFPKIVHSKARAGSTDALKWTLLLTGGIGAAACLLATVAPWLPELVISKGKYAGAATLVPWFAWSMLIFTMANVLIGNLLARSDFRCVNWLVCAALAYGLILYFMREPLRGMPAMPSFRLIVAVLTVFNLQLLIIGIYFIWGKGALKSEQGKAISVDDA